MRDWGGVKPKFLLLLILFPLVGNRSRTEDLRLAVL